MKVIWIIGLISVSADWRVSETPLSNSSPIHSARPRWNCAAQSSGAIWDQWSIDDFATRVNIHLSSLKKGQAWARHMSSWKWRHSSHIVMTLTSSCHLPLPVLQWPLCSVLWFCMFIFCVVGMRTEITNSNNMAQVVMEHSVLKGGGSEKYFFPRKPKVCFGQLGQVIECSTLRSTFQWRVTKLWPKNSHFWSYLAIFGHRWA